MLKDLLIAGLVGCGLGAGGVVVYQRRRAIGKYVRTVRKEMAQQPVRKASAKRKAKKAKKVA